MAGIRIEAASKVKGEDGLPMTKDFVIPINVDTQGPELKILTPNDGDILSGTATIEFTAEESANSSGLESLSILLEEQPGDWVQLEVNAFQIEAYGKNTFVRSLDLSPYGPLETLLRVEGSDCLGNVSQVDVFVIIGEID